MTATADDSERIALLLNMICAADAQDELPNPEWHHHLITGHQLRAQLEKIVGGRQQAWDLIHTFKNLTQ